MKQHFLYKTVLFLLVSMNTFSQKTGSIAGLLQEQREVFPQEKLYLHTDKSVYLSGENIWFRGYLLDASFHQPSPVSQYIYVELINALDSIVNRVKIKLQDEAYAGYIPLNEAVAEGDYILRAYTLFMQNMDEAYMFRKKITVLHPLGTTIETRIDFETGRKGEQMVVIQLSDRSTEEVIHPKRIEVTAPEDIKVTKKSSTHTHSVSYSPAGLSAQPAISVKSGDFQKLITVPNLQEEFDVAFLPEGGNMLANSENKIAFKAIKEDGQYVDINGFVRNETGDTLTKFSSLQFGMGCFSLTPQSGETYYAVCESSNGYKKEFELPESVENTYSLSTGWTKNGLQVIVKQPGKIRPNSSSFSIVGHTRGIVQFETEWDGETDRIVVDRDNLPPGILHILLLDAQRNILSERLVFNNNEKEAPILFTTNKKNYNPREEVKVKLQLSPDIQSKAHLSVSVVDANDMVTDSTTNMLSYLLLSSELKGYIHHPGYYFNPSVNKRQRERVLDVLMMTQGWRRYDIPALIKGEYSTPSIPLEIGQEISGTVKGLIARNLVKGSTVTLTDLEGKYGDVVTTDKEGRFYFNGFDLPDSTHYLIQALSPKGKTNIELLMDDEVYPPNHIRIPVQYNGSIQDITHAQQVEYITKADTRWRLENGVRTITLGEVIVTQKRKEVKQNKYLGLEVDYSFSREVIEKRAVVDLTTLFYGTGAEVRWSSLTKGVKIILRPNFPPARVIIDGIIMPEDFTIDEVETFDVETVQVLKPGRNSVFGIHGIGGFIIVNTRKGEDLSNYRRPQYHNKLISPLGYQSPAEFYTPKYDFQQKEQMPDFRTTIHWAPNLQTDEKGTVSFSFFCADSNPNYWVIIEGVTETGEIISLVETIQ